MRHFEEYNMPRLVRTKKSTNYFLAFTITGSKPYRTSWGLFRNEYMIAHNKK